MAARFLIARDVLWFGGTHFCRPESRGVFPWFAVRVQAPEGGSCSLFPRTALAFCSSGCSLRQGNHHREHGVASLATLGREDVLTLVSVVSGDDSCFAKLKKPVKCVVLFDISGTQGTVVNLPGVLPTA